MPTDLEECREMIWRVSITGDGGETMLEDSFYPYPLEFLLQLSRTMESMVFPNTTTLYGIIKEDLVRSSLL